MALTDSSGDVRVNAAKALNEIEPGNRDALRALIKELRGETSEAQRAKAASALTTAGRGQEPAVTALLEAMADADEAVGNAAMCSLREMVPCTDEALPALWRAFRKEPPGELRAKAAYILTLAQDNANAVPVLIRALEYDQQPIRNLAAHMLGAYGDKAKAAIPALTKALKDSSPQVRETAAQALEEIRRHQ